MTNEHIGAAGDVVVGAQAIAHATGLKPRQIYHLASTGALPGAFRLGGRLAVSRRAYRAALEAACAATTTPRVEA